MKDVTKLLSDIGVSIPEDKKEAFNTAFHENYKTVAEVSKLNSKLTEVTGNYDTLKAKYEADMNSRNEDLSKLKATLDTLKAGNSELEGVKAELESLKATYTAEKESFAKDLEKKSYEFGIKEKLNELKFSSNSAKKAMLSDLLANPLPIKDGNVLGFDDYVTKYREEDANAFIEESPAPEPPKFAVKNSGMQQSESEPDTVDNKQNIIW